MAEASVIGCGRWGTFLAWYLIKYQKLNHIFLYGLENSQTFQNLQMTRKNEYLSIPNNILLTSDLTLTLKPQYIVISIDAQNLNQLSIELNNYNIENKTFILAMKGIDIVTKKRLSEIMHQNIKQKINVAVLLGPGHVQDYIRGVPNCAIIDGDNDLVKNNVIELMKSSIMRLYIGNDLIGNEIGAAYKNIIGIAGGILDGLGWGSLKGALMARSIAEVGRFIEKCGGNSKSACGLSFLGDFGVTLFSKFSNNRLFGELFVKGETTNKNCEGFFTLKAVYEMGKIFQIEMPITETLYDIVYNNIPISFSLDELFNRKIKNEFE